MENRVPLGPYILLALSMVGLGITAYLSYFQYLNLIPSCAIGGCEVVLTSEYSKFFGVPLSYLGLVYFAYLFCLSALLSFDPHSKGLRWGALLYTGFGVLYFAYALFYVQAILIGAFCQYCIMSAITTTIAFGVSLYHYRSSN